MKAAGNYAIAKLAPFPVELQMENSGDVYIMTMRVQYKDLPPPPIVDGNMKDSQYRSGLNEKRELAQSFNLGIDVYYHKKLYTYPLNSYN